MKEENIIGFENLCKTVPKVSIADFINVPAADVIAEIDLQDYIPPIEITETFNTFYETYRNEKENTIVAKVREQLGVFVDKEELIKALQGDRHQYQKGFNDATKRLRGEAEWEYNEECITEGIRYDEQFKYKCGKCGMPSKSNNHRFCSQCGTRMKPKRQQK